MNILILGTSNTSQGVLCFLLLFSATSYYQFISWPLSKLW